MKLFFDMNISHRVPKALQCLFPGDELIHLTDRFPKNVADTTWIPALGDEGGWIVFSGDFRITKRAAEKHAFKQAKLKGLFFSPGLLKKRPEIQTCRIIMHWSQIESISRFSGGATFQMSETKIKQI